MKPLTRGLGHQLIDYLGAGILPQPLGDVFPHHLSISSQRGGEDLDSREIHVHWHGLPRRSGKIPDQVERFLTPKTAGAATQQFVFTPGRLGRRPGRPAPAWPAPGVASPALKLCPGTEPEGCSSRSLESFCTARPWPRSLASRARTSRCSCPTYDRFRYPVAGRIQPRGPRSTPGPRPTHLPLPCHSQSPTRAPPSRFGRRRLRPRGSSGESEICRP